jgi:hypothetical protein
VPSYETRRVAQVISARPGLQRVRLDDDSRAYVLVDLIGEVAQGDQVVVNTTAVELDLGTGGWHVVHWNLARDRWLQPGPGHVMKLRYTSSQLDSGAAGETFGELPSYLHQMPVVVCSLHSQIAAVAAAFAQRSPGKRMAYVMTDGAALPLALSDLVAELVDRKLLATTITAGQAFGGDHEAVGTPDALALASTLADATVLAMGPGGVGTGTALGASALEAAAALWTVQQMGGLPIAAVRASQADPRGRHRGLSDHWRTILGLLGAPGLVPTPAGLVGDELRDQIAHAGVAPERIVAVECPDVVDLFDQLEMKVTSMGRPASQDRLFFSVAAAAGVMAGARLDQP